MILCWHFVQSLMLAFIFVNWIFGSCILMARQWCFDWVLRFGLEFCGEVAMCCSLSFYGDDEVPECYTLFMSEEWRGKLGRPPNL
jgi:hypothetical protein